MLNCPAWERAEPGEVWAENRKDMGECVWTKSCLCPLPLWEWKGVKIFGGCSETDWPTRVEARAPPWVLSEEPATQPDATAGSAEEKHIQALGTWLLHLPGFSPIYFPCVPLQGRGCAKGNELRGEWTPCMKRRRLPDVPDTALAPWASFPTPLRVQDIPFGWVFKSIIVWENEVGLWFCTGTWAPAQCSHLGQAVPTANTAWPLCPAWYRAASSAKLLGNPFLSKEMSFRFGF